MLLLVCGCGSAGVDRFEPVPEPASSEYDALKIRDFLSRPEMVDFRKEMRRQNVKAQAYCVVEHMGDWGCGMEAVILQDGKVVVVTGQSGRPWKFRSANSGVPTIAAQCKALVLDTEKFPKQLYYGMSTDLMVAYAFVSGRQGYWETRVGGPILDDIASGKIKACKEGATEPSDSLERHDFLESTMPAADLENLRPFAVWIDKLDKLFTSLLPEPEDKYGGGQ
jgi:hypothetical protein